MTSVSRLIHTFAPEHYDLSINLNRLERTFEGTVSVTGISADNATDIRLHAKDLTITSALVDGKEAQFSLEENDELAVTHADLTNIQANTQKQHIVVVAFNGAITDDMVGIYPCYFEVNGEKKELIATQLESHYARQAFPCIDEPEAKATFNVTLQTEQDVTVLGNMPVKTQRVENELLTTSFETTPRMSTYLVAWVVGELQKRTTKTKGGVEVSVWSTKAHSPESLDFALDISARTIDFFDEYFGVPYPLPKSDHVALPDFSSGAMENWGLITYREIALLADPKNSSIDAKRRVALVVAHELSHQWFGNLVTMKWWNDLWLNESFANMMEFVVLEKLEPTWNVWLDHASSDVISALRRDSLDGVQSIQIDVNHPDEISTIFDPSIVYAKGSRLLRMLQAYLGDDDLRKGLKRYFETYAYGNTVADNLWECLSTASGKDVAGLMNAWMVQSGYPVVSVTHSSATDVQAAEVQGGAKESKNITLTQSQFFIGPHQDSTKVWPIPLHGASSQIPAMLETASTTFEYTDMKPFQLNVDGTTHFITHYDDASFAELLENLDQLSLIDRLQLLHEQTLLAQAGLVSSAQLIPLIQRYKNETNEEVWSIIALAIGELKRFVETDDKAEQQLRAFVADVVAEQYTRLGWQPTENEAENDTRLRSTIIGLSLYGEIPDALETAKQLYLGTEITELDPELRVAVMAHAVRSETTPTVVDDLLSHYKTTNSSEMRDDIASALTSTKNEEVIKLLAGLIKNSAVIRPQDFTHWFVWLLRNRYGRTFMWQWARDEWPWITEKFIKDSHFDMFPRYIGGSLINKQQLEEYKTFFKPFENDLTLGRNIAIGITDLSGKVTLLERDGPVVRAALHDL